MRPPSHHNPSVPPGPNPTADRLDRVWAATRPPEPSPAMLDTLWAHASAELDRIEATRTIPVIPFDPTRAHRRRRFIASVAVAQAAAILLAVGLAWNYRTGHPGRPALVAVTEDARSSAVAVPVVANQPKQPVAAAVSSTSTTTAMVVVEVDKTLVVRINDDDHKVEQVDQTPMLSTMADNTAHDFFNAMESLAIP